jgi:hypothetical protein
MNRKPSSWFEKLPAEAQSTAIGAAVMLGAVVVLVGVVALLLLPPLFPVVLVGIVILMWCAE